MSEIVRIARAAAEQNLNGSEKDVEPSPAGRFVDSEGAEMNSRPIPPTRFAADDPTRVYFWIAFVAFTAVAAGWAVNSLLSGWMEVAGVGAIGLFYLGLGMLELGRRSY